MFAAIAGLALAILSSWKKSGGYNSIFLRNVVVLFWFVLAAATDGKHGNVNKHYMRKNIFLITSVLLGFLSCKHEKTEKRITPDKTQKVEEKNIKPIFSQNDFDLVYQYFEGDSKQLLGININDKKNLSFHLVTKTLPCDTEYWGIAENKYSDLASEVDEDENGTAYGVNEYSKTEKEYSIYIRLAIDSSKVIVNYVEENIETDCLPITEKIMNRIK